MARSELQKSLDALEQLGDQGQWKMAPPGLGQLQQQPDPTRTNPSQSGDTGAPLDYGLRSQIRRQREDVERAERALRDLQVEANLAGVPEDWR